MRLVGQEDVLVRGDSEQYEEGREQHEAEHQHPSWRDDSQERAAEARLHD